MHNMIKSLHERIMCSSHNVFRLTSFSNTQLMNVTFVQECNDTSKNEIFFHTIKTNI